jgi:hypothetical protein
MGIALLAIADFWMPLQSLANRLIPARRPHARDHLDHLDHNDASAGLRYVAVRPACASRNGASTTTPAVAAAPARPLRVVRVVDGKGQQRNDRVVISGRMADVCAELDRLAALETAETLATAHRSTRLH